MTKQRRAWLAGLGLAVALASAPARADSIDGHWCFTDGRDMTINGPGIVTPGGVRTVGNYDRHAFSYKVPDGEAGAGATVSMILANESTVYLWRRQAQRGETPEQVWRRCAPSS